MQISNGVKTKRYWLRGGVVGFIIMFTFLSLSIFAVSDRYLFSDDSFFESLIQLVKTFPALEFFFSDCAYQSDFTKDDLWYLDNCLSHQEIDFYSGIINIGLYSLIGFLGGAFWGYFYGKVKNRKNSHLTPKS